MTIEFVSKKFIDLYFFAIARKKIFFIWLLIYLLGHIAIYFFKLNNYEVEFKIRFFAEFPATQRIFDRGLDALMYKFKHSYMIDEKPRQVDTVYHFHLKGKSPEEIINKVKVINLKVDNLKNEIMDLTIKIDETLENEYKDMLLNEEIERKFFFDWYYKQKFQNKLFVDFFKDYYVINDFNENDIKNINTLQIIKSFSFYILIIYLFNLIILIFHKKNL